ncbi:hypothetical protein ACFSUH_00005 [Rhodococcus jostii]|uniref:hypothetical protein n=1 Tax=Rhodococcus jostii TaxID=132919 RepID=UPI00363F9C87
MVVRYGMNDAVALLRDRRVIACAPNVSEGRFADEGARCIAGLLYDPEEARPAGEISVLRVFDCDAWMDGAEPRPGERSDRGR